MSNARKSISILFLLLMLTTDLGHCADTYCTTMTDLAVKQVFSPGRLREAVR